MGPPFLGKLRDFKDTPGFQRRDKPSAPAYDLSGRCEPLETLILPQAPRSGLASPVAAYSFLALSPEPRPRPDLCGPRRR
jgi:hypothetical protein